MPGRAGERDAVALQVLPTWGTPRLHCLSVLPAALLQETTLKILKFTPKRFPQPGELAFALVHSPTVLLLSGLLWQGGSGFTQDHLWSRSPSWQKP